MERTLVILKPDCVAKGLMGEVIRRFEKAGMKVMGLKMMKFDEELAREHYAHHADKEFFPELLLFITSAPVVCMVLEGENAVERVRELCGATDPRKAASGTIRADFGESVQRNVVHASDSLETAKTEIARFFNPEEIYDYKKMR